MLRGLMHSPVVFLTFFFLLLASGDGRFTTGPAVRRVVKKIAVSINIGIEDAVSTKYAEYMVAKR